MSLPNEYPYPRPGDIYRAYRRAEYLSARVEPNERVIPINGPRELLSSARLVQQIQRSRGPLSMSIADISRAARLIVACEDAISEALREGQKR